MNKTISLFGTVAFRPLCLMAQTVTPTLVGHKEIIEDRIFKLSPRKETLPAHYLKAKFDIFSFFKEFNPLAINYDDGDEAEAKKAKEDFRKFEELGFTKDDIGKGDRAWVCKRGPFNFVWYGGTVYLINPKTTTEAMILELSAGFFPDKEEKDSKRKLANEVDGITVERMKDDTYRIFVESLGGDQKWGKVFPHIDVFDCDLKKYYFSLRFRISFCQRPGEKGS